MEFAVDFSRNDLKEELKGLTVSLKRALRDDFEEICTRLGSLERAVQVGNDSKAVNLNDVSTPPTTPLPLSPSPPKADPPNLGTNAMLNCCTEEEAETCAGFAEIEVAPRATTVSFSEAKLGLHQRRQSENHDWLSHHWRSYATGREARLYQMHKGLRRQSQRRFSDMEGTTYKVRQLALQASTVWEELDDDGNAKRSFRTFVGVVVASNLFQSVIATTIFVNAFIIGLQTEYMAEHKSEDIPVAFRVLEVLFCIIFSIEIVLKLIAYRLWYFTMSGWRWNVFDLLLVLMQLVEEIFEAVMPFSLSDFSAMRVLRILRVVRVIRVIRLIRLISDLRAIVSSILGSMRALVWTVLLLFLVIYMIGVYLTQLYAEERIEGRELHESSSYYSDLPRSILTLYQCISGGLDWDDAVTPLIKDFSPMYGVLFSLYISFTVLALMNVVTGVFVESALQSAREDKNIYIVNHIQALIDAMMIEKDGFIGWEVFEAKLETEEMAEVFSFIDVDPMEARGLFKLLDLNGNGYVDSKEFLDGCLRLRGPAKALDMALLMTEMRRLAQVQQSQFEEIVQVLKNSQRVNSNVAGSLRNAATDIIGHPFSK